MIVVAGAGAFGTALAIALAQDGREVCLWARAPEPLIFKRHSLPFLQGAALPDSVTIRSDSAAFERAKTILLAVPMQSLSGFLGQHKAALNGKSLVACCKGVDLETLRGPSAVIAAHCPDSAVAVLTGPSFAADIAKGLPTALTLAGADEALQRLLSTKTLRLYRSADVIGAELGGALKNVIAIAAGVVIGANLGDSARAAVMTRGFAELQRFALTQGAKPETLSGLSGFGDLVLTCTSDLSRNFQFGLALGQGRSFDPTVTVEGAATSKAVAKLAVKTGIDLPLTTMIAALIAGSITLNDAISALLSRPLKQE